MAIFNRQQQRPMTANTMTPFELANGETVNLTLAWVLLVHLKGKNSDMYRQVSKILSKGTEDILDNIVVLHAAYLCAYLHENGTFDGSMDYMDFVALVPNDMKYVGETVRSLIDPKFQRDSEAHS